MIVSKTCFVLFKKFFRAHVAISFSFLLLPLSIIAQPNAEKGLPFITNYLAKDYQASPQNWSIIEDDRGMMYFGNGYGLLEYDGINWRMITWGVNSIVRSLSKDKNGRIYCGGYGNFGYLAPDSLGQTQLHSLLNFVPGAYRNFNDVWTVHVTEQGIYFQSREYIFRLRKINGGTKENWEVRVWNSPNANKFMFAFYLDNTYYVHQQGVGLIKMVNDSLVVIPGSEFMGNERVQVMLPYTSSNAGDQKNVKKQYLLGAFYSGLYLYNGASFTHFATETDSLIKNNTLYKGILLSDGSYALATAGKGVIVVNNQGKKLQQLNREIGLQDESVYAIYTDRKGTLWMALDNGISRVESASPFTQFTVQSGITTATITINRFKDILYIGTTNGLLRFNSNTAKFEQVRGLTSNQVFTLTTDGNSMLISTDGLFYIRDNKPGVIKKSVAGDLLISALTIYKKNILFAGVAGGIAIFKKPGNEVLKEEKTSSPGWVFAGNIPGISEDIWSFAEGSGGTMWAGTQQGVLRLSDFIDSTGNPTPTKAHVERFGSADGLSEGSIHVSSVNDKVFFISNRAVYRFNEINRRFITDNTFGEMGFGNDPNQYVMTTDDKGRVWLNFGKETALALPQKGGGYRVEKTPFLPLVDHVIANIFPEANGTIWFATTDGLIKYNENLKKDYDEPFKTLLRNVIAGKQALHIVSSDNQQTPLDYKQNTLRFEYAAAFFEQEKKTQYQTWLEGFEPDWSAWGNNTYKEYTNLPNGKYHFHVRAMNIYQKVGKEAVYTFTIQPPWYRTWWAYLLYSLVAIAIVYLLISYRTHQLHIKHRELEKTVSERTAELSQRVEELAVINSVQESLVAQMDIQAIYDLIGNKICNLFDAQAVLIATLDQDTKTEHFNYAIEKGERFYLKPRQYDKLRQHLIETREKILINNNYEEAAAKFGLTVLPGTENPKSLLFVPLSIGDKVKSYVSLQYIDKENAFTEADVRLLETLANSTSVAIENARLFDQTNRLLKETEQRNAELAVINSVQESLVAQMNMQAIYDLVGEKMREIFNAQVIDIVTYDKSANLIEDRYSYEKGDRTLIPPRKPSGFRKHVIETKQLLWHNENVEQVMREFSNDIVIGDMPKSQVYVPMIAGGEVTGVISLQNLDQEHAFSESNVSLLTTLANSMSVALESARLFDETNRLLKETEQRTAELAVINSVQEGLAHELDMQGIYNLVGDRVQKLFNAQGVIIASFDLPNKKEYFNYAFENGEKYNIEARTINEMRQMIIDKKHTIYIETEEKASTEFGITAIGDTKMPKSLLFVPLLSGSEIKGYVSLQNVDTENAFSQSDIRLLETLSNSMTVALENIRLFDETSRLLKETKQRTAELALINSVQEGLVREMDIQSIYDLVGDRVQKLFQAQTVVIATFNFANKTEQFNYVFENNKKYNFEPRPINKLRQLLIEKKQTIYIETEEKARNEYGIMAIEDSEMPKSLLFVPLLSGKEIKGYISLQNIDIEHAFNQSDISLLETLINSMSVALENARLFDETKILLAETEKGKKNVELLSDIGKEITASLDFETIFYKLYDHINQLADATIFGVGIYQPEHQQIEYKFAIEEKTRYAPYTRSTTDKNQFPVWCIEKRQPVFINDVRKEYKKYITTYDEKPLLLEDGTYAKEPASIIYLPLIVQERILGIITIQSFQKNAYTEYHLNLLQNLATYTSIALDNANAYRQLNIREQEIGQRAAELSTVNSISQALASQLDLGELIKLVGNHVHQLFKSNISYVALLDQKTKIINFPYQVGEKMPPRKLGVGFTSKIILSGKPLLINKEINLKSQELGVHRVGIPAASYLGVPVPVGDEIIGVLSVQSTEQENRFTEKDQRLLSTIAAHVGIALRKARLFEEVKQKVLFCLQ